MAKAAAAGRDDAMGAWWVADNELLRSPILAAARASVASLDYLNTLVRII